MKTGRLLSCLLLLALVAAAATAAPEPLRVLILTGQNNHDWKSTTPVLEEILERSGRFAVDVTEDPSTCDAATFARYDALVSNYNGARWGETTEQALLDYMKAGGGFVVIHAANNAFGDWPEYDPLIGGAWRGGAGHGDFHRYMVTIADPQHPITKGMVDFLHGRDELYHRLTIQPNIHLLATAYSAPETRGTGRDEPVAWTVAYGKGRVFHTVLGHDGRSMSCAGFKVMLQRGTEWVATGKVTLPAHRGALALSGLATEDAQERYALQNRLIEQGAAALPALFDAYAVGSPKASDEARATLLWVVQRWAGTPSRGEEIASALLHYISPDQPLEVRRFALILVGLAGDSQAVPKVARLLGDEDLCEPARQALAQLPGSKATAALVSALRQAQGPARLWLLQALGARRDAAAMPALLAAAREPEEAVRIEAIAALGRIGSSQAAPMLLEAAKTGPPTVKAAALEAYLRVADTLLERSKANEAGAMYGQALRLAATDALRMAAIVGLGRIGDPRSLEALTPFLTRGDPRVRATAAAAVDRIPGPAPTRALIEAVEGAPPEAKSALLNALARRAAPAALAVVMQAARDPEESVRLAALMALGTIGDPAAAPTVRAALAADSQRVRSAAVAAALRTADREFERGRAESAAAMYLEALGAATADRQRIAALRGIARVPDPEALPSVAALLEGQPDRVSEAALDAYIALGRQLAEGARREEAIAVLSKALDLVTDPGRALLVGRQLQELGVPVDLAAVQGFVNHWWVIGPFPNPDGAAFETAYPPEQEIELDKEYEQDGKTLTWRHHVTDSSGIIWFERLFQPKDNVCAYAYAEVTVQQAQDVLLKIGSNDDALCWLNGQRVLAAKGKRGLTVDQDVVKARLEAGANRILLKVLNGSGNWAGVLRITDPNGRTITFETRAA